MSRRYQIKQDQKELAILIRKKKNLRKKSKDGYVEGLPYLRNEYRHIHIAYCLLNDTPYERIEQPQSNNKPNMKYVNRLIDEWKEKQVA